MAKAEATDEELVSKNRARRAAAARDGAWGTTVAGAFSTC
jgi:hypothetical protein